MKTMPKDRIVSLKNFEDVSKLSTEKTLSTLTTMVQELHTINEDLDFNMEEADNIIKEMLKVKEELSKRKSKNLAIIANLGKILEG